MPLQPLTPPVLVPPFHFLKTSNKSKKRSKNPWFSKIRKSSFKYLKRKWGKFNCGLNHHDTIISMFLAIGFGFWGIYLTKKYGENKDQIKELKNIVSEQKNINETFSKFLAKQVETNDKLVRLDSIGRAENKQLETSIFLLAWEPVGKLIEDSEKLTDAIRVILANLYAGRDSIFPRQRLEYFGFLKNIRDALDQEKNNPLLKSEKYESEWANALQMVEGRIFLLARLDSTIGTIQDSTRRKSVEANYLRLVRRFFSEKNSAWTFFLSLPREPLVETDKVFKFLEKRKVIEISYEK